jgi:hypothetical protein
VESLRKDPEFTFSTSGEMFDHYCHITHNLIQPKLKKFFLSEPAFKLV